MALPPPDPRLDAKIPPGPLPEKWDLHRSRLKLVNPANRRKYSVIVVGTGLAGAAAAATLGELGYKVKAKKVLTVRVTDRIGAGAEIGALLGNAVIDICYSYGTSSGEGKTLLVFHTSNNRKALDTLK